MLLANQNESRMQKVWRWTKYLVMLKFMDGSSIYEKINMVQNFLSICNLALKLAFDRNF